MRRKVSLAAAGTLTLALGLAACSSIPVLEVDSGQSGLEPGMSAGSQSEAQSGPQSQDEALALTDAQVERIVADVQEVLDESDTSGSEAPLAKRVVDPALSLRTGQLTRASYTGTELAPLIIGNAVHSATAGTSFPRVLVVASEPTVDDPAEVFFLTQKDAKSDYMLESWVRLLGGTPVKGLGVKDGSTVITADATGLKLTPAEVVNTYVNYLNSPDNAEYQYFTDNVFEPRYREELNALSEASAVAGTVTNEAWTWDVPTIGVMLNTGQALISTSFKYTQTYTKTVEGATLSLTGTPAAYLDDPNVESSVAVEYQVNVFFLVPPEGSDEQIAVVGAERVIQSVTKADPSA